MECLESKILKTEMFEFWYVNIESWKLNFEICMWDVWNLQFWELKCLNWYMWTLKAENWKLKSLCEAPRIWKLKCLNLDVWIESWKLKFENSLWHVWKECKILKTEMFEY